MTQAIPPDQADKLKVLLKPIAELFKASRITLIVRSPEEGNAAGSCVLSNDNPTLVLQTLRTHMEQEAQRFAAEASKSGSPEAEFPKHRNLDEL